MPNPYFQFKQFTVFQDQCAMKVCTDSCILGAYAPVANRQRILDIGTGTGLLALMAAQRSDAQIDAVEIASDAYHQALANIQQSPWKDRIRVYFQSIQQFSQDKTYHQLYDFIITNPPFYTKHLPSPSVQRNIALHAQSLNYDELLDAIKALLSPKGEWMVLLPSHESALFEKKARNQGFEMTQKLIIKNKEEGSDFRVISLYSELSQGVQEEILSIRKQSGEYSEDFKNLLKEYYLIF